MNELFNVKDKVVVITGGAGILGKGIAAYLAKEGAKVVVLDRSEEAGKALVDSIKAEGNEAMFLYTDVMDKEVLEGNKVEIMKAYLFACSFLLRDFDMFKWRMWYQNYIPIIIVVLLLGFIKQVSNTS